MAKQNKWNNEEGKPCKNTNESNHSIEKCGKDMNDKSKWKNTSDKSNRYEIDETEPSRDKNTDCGQKPFNKENSNGKGK